MTNPAEASLQVHKLQGGQIQQTGTHAYTVHGCIELISSGNWAIKAHDGSQQTPDPTVEAVLLKQSLFRSELHLGVNSGKIGMDSAEHKRAEVSFVYLMMLVT